MRCDPPRRSRTRGAGRRNLERQTPVERRSQWKEGISRGGNEQGDPPTSFTYYGESDGAIRPSTSACLLKSRGRKIRFRYAPRPPPPQSSGESHVQSNRIPQRFRGGAGEPETPIDRWARASARATDPGQRGGGGWRRIPLCQWLSPRRRYRRAGWQALSVCGGGVVEEEEVRLVTASRVG
jgi:hypothetical protein